jgi:ribonuclease G
MSKELVISSNRHETKVAILEDDQLVEVYFQRANEYSLAGSVHKGRVTRVLPGMQSAFVDLGLDRDTFLYVSDFSEENEDYDRIETGPVPGPERLERIKVSAPPEEPPAAAEAVVENPASPADTAQREQRGPAQTQSEEDRRGRRSRRRRRGSRGFPESKYASVEDSQDETSTPSEEQPSPPDISSKADVIVLPGESLAKYRHPSAGPAAADEETARPEHAEASSADEDTEPFPADIAAIPNENPEEQPPVNALPDAPEHHYGHGAAPALELVPRPKPIEEGVSEAEPEFGETGPELSAADAENGGIQGMDEIISDGSDTLALHGDEDEDREIQALILEGDTGGIDETESTTTDDNKPQTASVREQGGRYMHRSSRRMRRKTRGGQNEAQPAGAPPVREPHPEPRQEHRPAPRPERGPLPSITDLLKEGQEILVPIAKEPLGQKGARITSHIALPGRYVVYMPTLDHMGVSRKIASDEERQRLKRILQKHRVGVQGGYIIRTAGEGKSEEDIGSDMTFLANLWLDIRQKAEKRPAPALLHHDLDIVQRILRDQVNDTFKSVWVDNEELYESILRFLQRFQPTMVSRVKLYTRPAPIYDAFNITSELEKALRPKVWLKSGGYIVINQTEALVAIDVNTGKYVGKSNRLEDTIVKTNTEAVKEIVRQIRLRDLGGIIVIDFIDMDERKNRQKVMQALEDAMRADRAPYKILQFNDFGLVAITRKRVKQSLERTLCAPCPYCEGAGYVKSVQTIIGEILQEAQKIAKAVEGSDVVLRVHPDVAKLLKSNQNRYLEELEEILKRPVLVKSDPALHHEKFDLA